MVSSFSSLTTLQFTSKARCFSVTPLLHRPRNHLRDPPQLSLSLFLSLTHSQGKTPPRLRRNHPQSQLRHGNTAAAYSHAHSPPGENLFPRESFRRVFPPRKIIFLAELSGLISSANLRDARSLPLWLWLASIILEGLNANFLKGNMLPNYRSPCLSRWRDKYVPINRCKEKKFNCKILIPLACLSFIKDNLIHRVACTSSLMKNVCVCVCVCELQSNIKYNIYIDFPSFHLEKFIWDIGEESGCSSEFFEGKE